MNLLAFPILLLLVAQDARTTVIPEYPAPAEVRAAFLKMLDRPKVPLDVQVLFREPRVKRSGPAVESEGMSIAVEKRADGEMERVPMLIFRPMLLEPPIGRKVRYPAVIVLHGTGGSGAGMGDWCAPLAMNGFVAVAIDGRHHGARKGKDGDKVNAYNEAITKAWKAKPEDPKTYPFYFDTCWDVWRTIDYLQTRDDVDPNRIGLMGISKGGIETWLAGAVDDRVKAAAPCIAVQSFRWSLDNDQWKGRANTIAPPHQAAAKDRGEPEVTRETCRALWNKVIPGMLDQFDCPSMLRLYAGRPLLIINGANDPNCPIGGVKVAIASAQVAYEKVNAADKLQVDIDPNNAHAVSAKQRKRVLDFFQKQLGPTTP
jgi:dienelactone hydrolase